MHVNPRFLIVNMGKHRSWSLKKLRLFLGSMGVFSESTKHLMSAFDFLCHYKGRLYYRMKPATKRSYVPPSKAKYPPQWHGHVCTFHSGQLMTRAETGPSVAVARCRRVRPDRQTGWNGRILTHYRCISASRVPAVIVARYYKQYKRASL